METVEVHYLNFGTFKDKMESEKVSFTVLNEAEVEFGGTDFYKIEVASSKASLTKRVLASINIF